MLFKDVIGQNEIKKRLIEAVKEQRVSHAQLFAGPEGAGKLSMALAYAQYVNCKNRTPIDSCGECSSCKKYQKLIHPDLHFVFPVIKNKSYKDPVSDNFLPEWRSVLLQSTYFTIADWNAKIEVENSQSSIYVTESDSIIRKLSLKTYEAEYKVMVIWMAERMNVQCANKLLKMIEEPPEKTLFILITEKEEQIISTIRSRTQLIRFNGIDSNSMAQELSKHPAMAGRSSKEVVHLSNGNYCKALELLNPSEEALFTFEQFCKIMRITYVRDWMQIFAWVDQLATIGREQQKSFLLYCMKMIRENFIFNLKHPDLVYLNDKEANFSQRFSPFINERNIETFRIEFENAFRDIAQNGNPRIIFLDLSLKITKIIKA